jgi:hypothetical protein
MRYVSDVLISSTLITFHILSVYAHIFNLGEFYTKLPTKNYHDHRPISQIFGLLLHLRVHCIFRVHFPGTAFKIGPRHQTQ